MAALLKSGKFIRAVTGLARPGQHQPAPSQQHSLLPLNNTTGTGNSGSTLGEKGGGSDGGGHTFASFQPWSLSNLQSALPALAGASENDETTESKDPLLGYLIDKQKVEEFCNKTWFETQKQLVELEKELKSEQRAIENKKDGETRPRESTLKSNAMFTKSRKKKITSKRKASHQSKNKELGRPISLNIIYEEPSQTLSSENEPTSAKNKSNTSIEVKNTLQNVVDSEVKTTTKSIEEEESISDKSTSNKSFTQACTKEQCTSDDQDKSSTDDNNGNYHQAKESIKSINSTQIEKEPQDDVYPPIIDDNWESRLPLLEFVLESNSNKVPPPGVSGVYYSEIPTTEIISEAEKTNVEPQPSHDSSGLAPAGYVPMVQVFEIEPYTQAHWYPLDVVCRTFRDQGRYWDLECLLDGSRSIRAEDRQTIYFWTLQAYADSGMFERAIALSGQLHLEGLGANFPAYHQLMSSFAAAQQSFAPTLPYSSYAYPESFQNNSNSYASLLDGTHTDISSQTCMTMTPSDVSLVSTPRSSCPPTPCPPGSEEQIDLSKVNLQRRSSQNYREDYNLCRPSRTSKSSTERKVSAAAVNSVSQHLHRRFKKALNDKNIADCLASYNQIEKLNYKRSSAGSSSKTTVSVTDSSSLIEMLVKDNRVQEATTVAENILASDAYPIPKIFRFLLNRLASNGDVEAMSKVGHYLTPRVKKEVSFDNRLCNAYLAAGRGSEYLHMLQNEVDNIISTEDTHNADPSNIQSVKDKFPRGGAMGLLESDPQLVESFTSLAYKFAKIGYIAPMNVLWTYHFIGGRHDIATPLWQEYVQGCPQIMFQKVCQTARSTCNADLAQRLVNVLEGASTVTMGARGIAYSCLIDVLTQQKSYIAGVNAVKKGLTTGVKLEDVNRTALKRLKQGLEETTNEVFPFEIPKKDGKDDNSAPYAHENEDRYESDNSVAMRN